MNSPWFYWWTCQMPAALMKIFMTIISSEMTAMWCEQSDDQIIQLEWDRGLTILQPVRGMEKRPELWLSSGSLTVVKLSCIRHLFMPIRISVGEWNKRTGNFNGRHYNIHVSVVKFSCIRHFIHAHTPFGRRKIVIYVILSMLIRFLVGEKIVVYVISSMLSRLLVGEKIVVYGTSFQSLFGRRKNSCIRHFFRPPIFF